LLGQQALADGLAVDIRPGAQDFLEGGFGVAVIAFAVPQRVVAVETDQLDRRMACALVPWRDHRHGVSSFACGCQPASVTASPGLACRAGYNGRRPRAEMNHDASNPTVPGDHPRR